MTTQRLVTAPAERTPAGAGARAINSIGEPAQQDCQALLRVLWSGRVREPATEAKAAGAALATATSSGAVGHRTPSTGTTARTVSDHQPARMATTASNGGVSLLRFLHTRRAVQTDWRILELN